jgi:hypothetical protein
MIDLGVDLAKLFQNALTTAVFSLVVLCAAWAGEKSCALPVDRPAIAIHKVSEDDASGYRPLLDLPWKSS